MPHSFFLVSLVFEFRKPVTQTTSPFSSLCRLIRYSDRHHIDPYKTLSLSLYSNGHKEKNQFFSRSQFLGFFFCPLRQWRPKVLGSCTRSWGGRSWRRTRGSWRNSTSTTSPSLSVKLLPPAPPPNPRRWAPQHCSRFWNFDFDFDFFFSFFFFFGDFPLQFSTFLCFIWFVQAKKKRKLAPEEVSFIEKRRSSRIANLPEQRYKEVIFLLS